MTKPIYAHTEDDAEFTYAVWVFPIDIGGGVSVAVVPPLVQDNTVCLNRVNAEVHYICGGNHGRS